MGEIAAGRPQGGRAADEVSFTPLLPPRMPPKSCKRPEFGGRAASQASRVRRGGLSPGHNAAGIETGKSDNLTDY